MHMCSRPYFADTIAREEFRRRGTRPWLAGVWQDGDGGFPLAVI
jgi:hypothetical protein